jgi:hypothetical protein
MGWTTNGICGATGVYRRHSLLLAHAHPRGNARAARMGRGPDAVVVRRNDRRRVDHPLEDSRSGGRGGALPWTLLVVGSLASLFANVTVAEPTTLGRIIAARGSGRLPDEMRTASYRAEDLSSNSLAVANVGGAW